MCQVFCSDILDALTQDFFARKGNPIEEPPNVEEIKVSCNPILLLTLSRLLVSPPTVPPAVAD